jgi:hypothetical protein
MAISQSSILKPSSRLDTIEIVYRYHERWMLGGMRRTTLSAGMWRDPVEIRLSAEADDMRRVQLPMPAVKPFVTQVGSEFYSTKLRPCCALDN